MRVLLFSLPPFLLITVPAAIVAGIGFRKRRQLPWYSDAAVLAPFVMWVVATSLLGSGKSLSNLFREPMLLGVVVGLSHAAFLALPGADRDRTVWRLALSIGFSSLVALALVLWYPILPE